MSFLATVIAVLAFAGLVVLSASLPCRPDQTILVGSIKMAGCSSAPDRLSRVAAR
jgi:hypothetical protein